MYHYVVIQNINKDKIVISDLAKGVLEYNLEDFYKFWTGILILIDKTMDIKKININKIDFWTFFKSIKLQKILIYNIIIISFIILFLGIFTSLYFKIVVDYVLKNKLVTTLNIIMTGVVFLLVIKSILELVRNQLILFLSQRIDDIILFGYYKHIINLPLNFFATRKIGEIISRFSDGSNIRQAISDILFTLTIDMPLSLLGGIILFYYNVRLFFVSLALLMLYFLVYSIFKNKIKIKNQDVLEKNAILTSNIIDNINGIETIKSYNLEKIIEDETDYRFIEFLKSIYNRGKLYNIINFISNNISTIGNYLIIWIGSNEVIKGKMSLGELFVFLSLLAFFLDPLKKIFNLQIQFQNSIVAANRIGEIFELELEEKKLKNKVNLNNLKEKIEIKNLKFRYGTRKLILDNININIKNKQKIAFIGESGSGKTTLAKLLMRYYDYEEGEIKIGGINIKDMNPYFLRDKISYVSQETFLFNKTIRENLFLDEKVEWKEILDLAEKLKILDFINELPNRFETLIEENGKNLSGGQRQRLSILRALLKKPDILILDEATSNLDFITEKSIKNVIDSLEITTIIIAHRLKTIKMCDKIFIFEKGKIIESGEHLELLEKRGKYFEFWEEQV
ncbi:peptidase domain-containing ABC transporter [Streptobacillus moniliformis]|uniref:peptidase domain-containing ABC transporter n=1 Tax=Streptobacillus moniliformis TaxID=34105 RepID=UPI0001A38C1D|nr:peptidase domain-containing ABC transporter [Streptobacillus moniliformis]AVL42680.1 peptidase domain-containing ABC transporter [Streptobacillus moniliformis]SQA13921.1 Lactococcin-G-processing and transport ATP-binding protein LagD [Streptobacillus moniliformis]